MEIAGKPLQIYAESRKNSSEFRLYAIDLLIDTISEFETISEY